MKDRFGREIQPGNAIAYAGTAGHSVTLDFYIADRVEENSLRGFKYVPWQKKFKDTTSMISDGSRAIIIPNEDTVFLL